MCFPLRRSTRDCFVIPAERRGFLRHFVPNNPQPAGGILCKSFALAVSVSKLTSTARSKIFAERRGFEPRKPFWSLHAFQACLFNHSSISPSRDRRLNTIRDLVAHMNFRRVLALPTN